jgi:hypothetical protein
MCDPQTGITKSGISLIKIFPESPFFQAVRSVVLPRPGFGTVPEWIRDGLGISLRFLRDFFGSSRRISEAVPKDLRRKSGKNNNPYRSDPGAVPLRGASGEPGTGRQKKSGKQENGIRLIPDLYARPG